MFRYAGCIAVFGGLGYLSGLSAGMRADQSVYPMAVGYLLGFSFAQFQESSRYPSAFTFFFAWLISWAVGGIAIANLALGLSDPAIAVITMIMVVAGLCGIFFFSLLVSADEGDRLIAQARRAQREAEARQVLGDSDVALP